MIGDRIRQLREARGWTQEHLAEVAGLAVRTVQRIEADHAHSAETLLGLAAALDIDARDLTRPGPSAPGEHRPLWPAIEPRTAGWAAGALTAPAIVFVTVNLLNYGPGFAAPYDTLARFGRAVGIDGAFEAASPALLLGLPIVAIVLVLAACVRPHGLVEGRSVTLTGVELRWHPLAFAAGLAAVLVAKALVVYLIGESFGHAARGTLG